MLVLHTECGAIASKVIRKDFTRNYSLRMKFDDLQKI